MAFVTIGFLKTAHRQARFDTSRDTVSGGLEGGPDDRELTTGGDARGQVCGSDAALWPAPESLRWEDAGIGAFERGIPGVPSRGGEVLSLFRVHTAAARVAGHANR